MAEPHAVVDAIAARLSALLNPASEVTSPAFKVAVRAHDGKFGQDGKDFTTFPNPCVLVFCAGWREHDEYATPQVLGTFVAVCIARTRNNANSQDSSGDVAMDLASAVHAIIDGGECWAYGTPAKDACARRGEDIRAVNEYTNGLAQKGVSVWTVYWRQPFEISSGEEPVYTLLKRIHFTLAGGPGDDIDAQLADATEDVKAMWGESLPEPEEEPEEP